MGRHDSMARAFKRPIDFLSIPSIFPAAGRFFQHPPDISGSPAIFPAADSFLEHPADRGSSRWIFPAARRFSRQKRRFLSCGEPVDPTSSGGTAPVDRVILNRISQSGRGA